MQQLINLYKETFGQAPETVQKLPGAGSNRTYYRLTSGNGSTVVGVVGTSVEENHAFVSIARHFREKGIRVPEVYAVSDDELRYLQQDLGGRSLFDALKSGRESGGQYSEKERELLRRTISQLPRIQMLGAEGMDWSVCYPQPEFDEENVMFDLNYFKYCFLKPSGVEFNEVKLQKEFKQMANDLTANQDGWGFMYRDFQARNIMLDDEDNPWFIDFQGGRRGPVLYDLVSFLWQASAKYPQELRDELISLYSQGSEPFSLYSQDSNPLNASTLRLFVLFRLLQVLGAYGYRGYFERKKHFLASIPPALENLKALLSGGACDTFPYLKKVLNDLINTQNKCNALSPIGERGSQPTDGGGERLSLTVRITSFSYKKGIPQDPSGNGGGYVFDCRSTHNPGRYEPYKMLTGLDAPVIRFLEEDGEILTFLESVYKLADFHVKRYIDRGFTSLMFSFGCTGGQHRSVYSAQHLADHLKERFGGQINIELTHREQRPQAFILAAGLGTRLKPLTDTMPKALVKVGDKTLLQRTIETLQGFGFENIVVNTHHFAEQIKAFVKSVPFPAIISQGSSLPSNQSLTLTISDETTQLLDTGGGLLKARHKFSQARPILIHNVDILSNADLKALYAAHLSSASCKGEDCSAPIATLLVSQRKSSRCLMFDDNFQLVGWKNLNTGEIRGKETSNHYAFSGIHIVSPTIFPLLEEYAKELYGSEFDVKGSKFSIIDFYLWACKKAIIKAYVQPDLELIDVGKIAVLEQINNTNNKQ